MSSVSVQNMLFRKEFWTYEGAKMQYCQAEINRILGDCRYDQKRGAPDIHIQLTQGYKVQI